MKIETQRIGEHAIEIEVDSRGHFSAEFNDQTFTSETKKGLVEQLQKAVKRAAQQGLVDVSVLGLVPSSGRFASETPFESGAGVVQAKLRAKHEREHNCYLLVTDDSAKRKFKVSGYSREGTIARRLTAAEVRRYLELVEAKRVADTALEDFVGEVKINPNDALLKARKAGGE